MKTMKVQMSGSSPASFGIGLCHFLIVISSSFQRGQPDMSNEAATRLSPSFRQLLWPLVALAVLLAFNLFSTPGFLHVEIKDGHLYGSLIDILKQSSRVMLLSLGMTLVIATAGVDLSVGAVMAIAGSVAAKVLVEARLGLPATIVATLSRSGTGGGAAAAADCGDADPDGGRVASAIARGQICVRCVHCGRALYLCRR